MEYRLMGKSGLRVSAIGLGGNTFGWKIDAKASSRIIDHALDSGINFIDTADMYDDGKSEEYIGSALSAKRKQVVIATKFGSIQKKTPLNSGSSRRIVKQSVEASLHRLKTDYIDLYQMHDPDPETPIEETLRALDDLIKAGKVLYVGCCDFSTWQLCDALWTSKANKLSPFISLQTRYNLLDRQVEKELAGFCQNNGVGMIPWGPLGGGFLTGKYDISGQTVETSISRAADHLINACYADVPTTDNLDKVRRLRKFCDERGHSLPELALAWLLSKPYVSTVSPSATSTEQLTANVQAINWKLTEQEIKEIDILL